MTAKTVSPKIRTMSFYKEARLWYADIPEFLKLGLGTKANLLMVDGSDSFLDFLSGNGNTVGVKMSTQPFKNHQFGLTKIKNGLNKALLNAIGHAPVDYGAYYHVSNTQNAEFHHVLWLCPVAEFVFQGEYPVRIFISKK